YSRQADARLRWPQCASGLGEESSKIVLLSLGNARPSMACDALHLHHVGGCFPDLAAERVVDIVDHLHHHACSLLLLFLIGSGVDRYLSICAGRGASHLGMAVVARYAKSHGELLHDLNNLLARPILGQDLKVSRRRSRSPLSTGAAATACARI